MWPGCAVRRTSRGLWLHGTGSPPHLIANAARHSAGTGRLRCDYCESSRQSRIDCDSRLSTVHMLLRLLLCAIFGSDDVMGGPDQVLVVRNDERLRLRLRLLFCQTSPPRRRDPLILIHPAGSHSRSPWCQCVRESVIIRFAQGSRRALRPVADAPR
jgi:hypothetical protein